MRFGKGKLLLHALLHLDGSLVASIAQSAVLNLRFFEVAEIVKSVPEFIDGSPTASANVENDTARRVAVLTPPLRELYHHIIKGKTMVTLLFPYISFRLYFDINTIMELAFPLSM